MKLGQVANKKVIFTFISCMSFLLVLYFTLSQIDIKNSVAIKESAYDIEAKMLENNILDDNTSLVKEEGLSAIKFASIPSYGDIALQYSGLYYVSSNPLTANKGTVQFNGHKETYYSEKVLPGNGLYIPGRHVADDGTIRDSEGYICVASDFSFMPRGSVLMTSLGPAKVYDTGCSYGTIDIYVSW